MTRQTYEGKHGERHGACGKDRSTCHCATLSRTNRVGRENPTTFSRALPAVIFFSVDPTVSVQQRSSTAQLALRDLLPITTWRNHRLLCDRPIRSLEVHRLLCYSS